MHPADLVILIALTASLLLGVFRGFVREAFSLAGWLAAYVVARLYHASAVAALSDFISTPSLRLIMAWGGLFVATLVVSMLIGYIVKNVVEGVGLGPLDRLIGGAFGLGRGLILVLALLVMIAPYTSQDTWWKEARLPQQFMRYELLGRELKTDLVNVAQSVGRSAENPAAASSTPK